MKRWNLGNSGVALALVTALALAGALAPDRPADAQSSFVVHLPSAPVEAAGRLAEAATALNDYLTARVPGLQLELHLFRRWSDANDYLEAQGDHVAMVLTEASFLLDHSSRLVATHRFRRLGQTTYRRVLVVRQDAEGVDKLVDLKGRSLAVVETSGSTGEVFLERVIFENEVSPRSWFSRVDSMIDDFLAVNAVLYSQADSALVAETNPLLISQLGSELRVVYTSPPLTLPVLAIREALFAEDQRRALERALSQLESDTQGRKVLAELKLDGIDALKGTVAQTAVALPAPRGKSLEVALPSGVDLALELPALPSADQLPFTVAVELPNIPLPREIPLPRKEDQNP